MRLPVRRIVMDIYYPIDRADTGVRPYGFRDEMVMLRHTHKFITCETPAADIALFGLERIGGKEGAAETVFWKQSAAVPGLRGDPEGPGGHVGIGKHKELNDMKIQLISFGYR